MLSSIKIQNLALVEELTWEPGRGLVSVTGETGAGKSVIVGATKLLLGERADKSLIRNGESDCRVEAVFHLDPIDEVNRRLAEHGLDPCEDNSLIVHRVISTSGNRQSVNCSPCTLQVLKSLGDLLVDLHGPHDHQSLLSNQRQLDMVDAFGALQRERQVYRDEYEKWSDLRTQAEELQSEERATEQEIDLLRFQVEEIDSAQIAVEEEEGLESRYRVSANQQQVQGIGQDILARLLESESSVLSSLEQVQRLLQDLQSLDPGVQSLVESVENAQVELQEAQSSLETYLGDAQSDPSEAAELERKIDTLQTLRRKYGSNMTEIFSFREEVARRLKKMEGRDDLLQGLQEQEAEALKKVEKTGMALSAARAKVAPKLAAEISGFLAELGFKQSHFEIELHSHSEAQLQGLEGVEFLFAPNPGEPSKALKDVASSGEMSRVMLAVKSALAQQDAIPLLIFDEIDANVGGEIATAVGRQLASLSGSHQVISITHLPQVAALAQQHFFVEKVVSDGRTRSEMREVKGDERRVELARMLGGQSSSALAHADTLMAESLSL